MALISGFGCDVSLRDPASHYAESGHLNEVLAILDLLVIRWEAHLLAAAYAQETTIPWRVSVHILHRIIIA